MKKIYLAALTLAMTACVSNEDLNPVDNYGYIDLNVSNDPIVETKASVTVEDLTGWVITANDGTNDHNLSIDNRVVAGTYTVTAKSHESMDAALTDWGEAYYLGSVSDVVVTKGAIATPEIDCGKAKNGRIKVSFSLPEVFTNYKVTVDGRTNISFDNTTSDKAAYFKPGNVGYSLSYSYNGAETKTVSGTIAVEAAKEHVLSISANDNGRISVTVKKDDSFDTGTGDNIEFDAATGEEVTNS